MKWFVAFIAASILSLMLISGVSLFHSFMTRQIVVWSRSDFMLGVLPRSLVEADNFFVKNAFGVAGSIIVASLVICFIVAARLKKK